MLHAGKVRVYSIQFSGRHGNGAQKSPVDVDLTVRNRVAHYKDEEGWSCTAKHVLCVVITALRNLLYPKKQEQHVSLHSPNVDENFEVRTTSTMPLRSWKSSSISCMSCRCGE